MLRYVLGSDGLCAMYGAGYEKLQACWHRPLLPAGTGGLQQLLTLEPEPALRVGTRGRGSRSQRLDASAHG